MKFKRIRAGYYEATTTVTVERDFNEEIRATFYLRLIPEWTGSEKWAVTAEGEHGERLINLTDSPCRTMAEAKRSAEQAASDGFKVMDFGGYASNYKG